MFKHQLCQTQPAELRAHEHAFECAIFCAEKLYAATARWKSVLTCDKKCNTLLDELLHITQGYRLPARHVIHTVGPVYRGLPRDRELLAACYRNSLELAVQHRLASIAFPSISCGVYGYPIEEACGVAVDATVTFLESHPSLQKVVFMLFSAGDLKVYQDRIERKKREP